ncbi:MAG TPA: hypothetical protein VHL14_10545 [Steroidobacteraceae bacterium]|jgi:hypothetical protein|nr:hypothetical protein [Steroidobacteraceae bacterium]
MRKLVLMMVSLLVGVVALSACGHKQEAAKPMDAKDTVFGDDIRALEKAKTVQDTLNKDKANTDKAIDTASDAKLPLSTD